MIFDPNPLCYAMLKIYSDRYANVPPKERRRLYICNEGGTRCFDPSQRIMAFKRHKRIKDVNIGDMVESFNHDTQTKEYRQVTDVIKTTEQKEGFNITHKDGTSIKVSESHRFYYNDGYTEISEIIRQHIEGVKHVNGYDCNKIASIEAIELSESIDITVEGNANYYLSSGDLVHNSSKTFDFFHFLVAICSNNKGLKVYCYRDTLKNCKDRTLQDFIDCLTLMKVYNADSLTGRNQSPVYDLFGNTIYFRGLDDDTESQASDICFFNEAVEMTEVSVKNAYMRCSMLCVFDWNPKYTDHWIFDMEGRPNVWFTRSTYQNNKHLKAELRAEIESWCPYLIEDLHLPEPQRRANLLNIKNKTVDAFRWKVYGEGMRGAMEGLIFDSVTYVQQPPMEFEARYFGLDFGNTTGTWAFSDNRKVKDGIVYDCPIYGSFEHASNFYEVLKAYYYEQLAIHKKQNPNRPFPQWLVIYDNANPQHANDLSRYTSNDNLEIAFAPCQKFDGCVEWRIGLMKKNGVILVARQWTRKEQENYFWDTVNGIALQKAKKDGHDHAFDSFGMSIQYDEQLR